MKIEKRYEKGDIVMLPVMIDGEAEPGSPYDYNVSYEDTIVGGRNPLFVKSTDIVEASDWESKYHEAEKEIAHTDETQQDSRDFAMIMTSKIRLYMMTDRMEKAEKLLDDEDVNGIIIIKDDGKLLLKAKKNFSRELIQIRKVNLQ